MSDLREKLDTGMAKPGLGASPVAISLLLVYLKKHLAPRRQDAKGGAE